MLKQKFNLNLSKTYTVLPENSFIESVTLIGNEAQIKMKSSDVIYNYPVSREQRDFLIQAGKENRRIGAWYNKYIKGTRLSKTVPV